MAQRRDLTPADACWLYSEWEHNHQTVSAFLWTDRRIDPIEFRELVRIRLVEKYPVFQQRAVMSRNPVMMPHWEDDPDFDIDHHLEVVPCPEPGDKAALEALISAQRTPLLDQRRPLWKIFLIQGYAGNTSAVHARIQHSIADGWSLVRLFLSLTDEEDAVVDPDPPAELAPDERGRRESPLRIRRRSRAAGRSLVESGDAVAGLRAGLHPASLAAGRDALDETLSLAADPARFVEFGSDITESLADRVQMAGARALASTSGRADRWTQRGSRLLEAARFARYGIRDGIDFTFPPRPGKTILHGQVSGQKKVVWMDPVPLDPIKRAGRVYGATINDVLMGAQTNALRQYLLDNDALTVDELFTAMPVSLRDPDEPLPTTLGNKFGLVPVLLPVGMADPVDQVLEIKRQIDEIKSSTMPIMSFGLMGFSAVTTADVERLIHKINQAHSIGVTTNVPGPRREIDICGAKVLGVWGMGGLSGHMNLSFGLFSLDGELNFAVHSDLAITPDPERVVENFERSLRLIQTRAGA